jgi:hypothetical protein
MTAVLCLAALVGIAGFYLACCAEEKVKAWRAAREARTAAPAPAVDVRRSTMPADEGVEWLCERIIRREATFVCLPEGADPRAAAAVFVALGTRLNEHLDEGERLAADAAGQ